MNTAKLTILKETFEQQFDIERFKKFTREFFNEPQMLPDSKRTGIWKEYLNHIKSYNLIAKYMDSDNNNVIVLAVELKKDSSIDRARSMQRNFISRVLDENQLEAAIVAFYTDNDPSWRLSFVRLDYSFKETGISLDLTPARRYSYLLGENEPNYTAQAQLLPIFEDDRHNPGLDEIEEAFTVEKVTKEFFNLYKEKYFNLKEYLENDSAFITETHKLGFEVAKFSEQFAKKLMGQLAFLYFLQKKGWLGVRIMPEDHTLSEGEYRKIYTVQDQAHKKVLDKVFKITKDKSRKLSAPALFGIDDHEAGLLSDCFMATDYNKSWGEGNRTFIREIFDFCTQNTNKNFFDDYLEPFFYEALNTKRKNHYFKTFNCKIPFLNGGLFEPLEGYHWRDVDFNIPNEIFSNKAHKGREADGILDIFDRFNFTIYEGEPLEKEVAVDPEMLGKIFENLLDVSDRKSKGAFYTPREIVHYMCQESLIHYLVNEVNVPYEDMKEFILYGELIRDADSRSQVGFGRDFTIKQSIYDNIVKIDEALRNVKIADPAVGSGAFPLGMLNEIMRALNNITEYIIRKDNEGFFNRKYGEDFIRKRRAPYKMKLETIKNSIFAVDIEPSAVDIAKLRLWLSVVVEQEIDADYPEPHPLPNLDMNIHVGNSLIDEYEGIKLFDKTILDKKVDKDNKNKKQTSPEFIQMSLLIDHTDEILQEMFTLQDRYFDEDNDESKKEIKEKIDRIRDELIRYKLQRDNNTDALKRYEESLKNKTKPYFIWEMEFAKIFKEKGGFDIVIGNPPYIDSENMVNSGMEQMRNTIASKFKYTKGNWDIYIAFFEIGYGMLSKNGTLTYITPDKWISKPFGDELRKGIVGNIISILNAGRDVFESALVDSIVTVISKNPSSFISVYRLDGTRIVKDKDVSKSILNSPFTLDIIFSDSIDIISKIENNSVPLNNWYLCENACATSDAYKLKEIIYSLSSRLEFDDKYLKIINTGTIGRFVSKWGYKSMSYLKDKYEYPVVNKKDFFNMFKNTYAQKSIKPKIIIKGLTLLDACIDEGGIIIPGKSTMIIPFNDANELRYLLAILNSKIMIFYIKQKYSSSSYNGGINFTKDMINNLPLKDIDTYTKELLIESFAY